MNHVKDLYIEFIFAQWALVRCLSRCRETLIVSHALVHSMAKHQRRRRRKWGSDMARIRLDSVPILGTLADKDMLIASLTIASDEEYRALSVALTWALRGLTAGEGSIIVGLAHGDYTAAEVEEWFEAAAAISRGDKILNEQNSRLCRQVGTFSGVAAAEVLNDGKPITTKLNWHIPEGKTLNIWVYNNSGGPLTTGAALPVNGFLTLRYQ